MTSSLFTKVFMGMILFLVFVMGARIIQEEMSVNASRAGFPLTVSSDNIGLIVLVAFAILTLIYVKSKRALKKNHN